MWAIVGALFASRMASADILEQTYFEPAKAGNIINLVYDPVETGVGWFFTNLKATYQFQTLKPAPIGTRFIATQFVLGPLKGSGGGDVMYIGINPPMSLMNYGGQAHFSYFGTSGGEIETPQNCNTGADWGPGITCAFDIAAQQGHKYELEANLVKTTDTKTLLQGFVSDFDEKGTLVSRNEIGRFWVNRGEMALAFPTGWVEGSTAPCSMTEKTSIIFGPLNVRYDRTSKGHVRVVPIDTVGSANCGVLATPTTPGDGNYVEMTYGIDLPPQ